MSAMADDMPQTATERVAHALCELGAWGCHGEKADGGTRLIFDLSRPGNLPDLTREDLADLLEMAGAEIGGHARLDLLGGRLTSVAA